MKPKLTESEALSAKRNKLASACRKRFLVHPVTETRDMRPGMIVANVREGAYIVVKVTPTGIVKARRGDASLRSTVFVPEVVRLPKVEWRAVTPSELRGILRVKWRLEALDELISVVDTRERLTQRRHVAVQAWADIWNGSVNLITIGHPREYIEQQIKKCIAYNTEASEERRAGEPEDEYAHFPRAKVDAAKHFLKAFQSSKDGTVAEISGDGRDDPRAMKWLIPEGVLK